MNALSKKLIASALTLFITATCSMHAACYSVENLVSDAADPHLVNPWGLSFDRHDALLVADNGANLATSYAADGTVLSAFFTVPTNPTGLVRNYSDTAFLFLYNSNQYAADFLLTTAKGQILAFAVDADPNNAIVVVDRSSNNAVYTGLTVGNYQGQDFLFATDFFNNNVDVFDVMFNYLFSFTDSTLPDGFAPFNVQLINDNLYVTFALQNDAKNDAELGMGNGFVDIFRPDGVLLTRLVAQNELDAPWGMTLAPSEFGKFGGTLLVGNFGNGVINSFDPTSGKFLGKLTDNNGSIISIDGLRSIAFCHKNCRTLYFTAGPNNQTDGLLGKIRYYYLICGIW